MNNPIGERLTFVEEALKDPDLDPNNSSRGPERAYNDARRRTLLNERAHLCTLALVDMVADGLEIEFEKVCKPAFTMTQAELQDRLSDWLVELMCVDTIGTDIPECKRLLLGWCAQLIVGNAPHSAHPPFSTSPEGADSLQGPLSVDMVDAARSIYAYAIDQSYWPGVAGRGSPDEALLLGLASFPLLEGVVRRRLASYMDEQGKIHTKFPSPDAEKSGRISNVGTALHLLESHCESESLAQRLKQVREYIETCGMSAQSCRFFTSGSGGFYEALFAHRNANVHGGKFVAHIGLAALVLATIVSLDTISGSFDKVRRMALFVVRSQAPFRIDGSWPHYLFFPVPMNQVWRPRDPHCWETIEGVGGNSCTVERLGPFSTAESS